MFCFIETLIFVVVKYNIKSQTTFNSCAQYLHLLYHFKLDIQYD
jgi:hypothetical protein